MIGLYKKHITKLLAQPSNVFNHRYAKKHTCHPWLYFSIPVDLFQVFLTKIILQEEKYNDNSKI